MLPFERLDICQLNPAQIAPLEALFADSWPDTWRELATSHYVTLLSAPGSEAVAQTHLAKLAVAEGLIDPDTDLLSPVMYSQKKTAYIEKLFDMLLRAAGK